MGVWDHWVPGANNALTALCSEWGAKNNVEVKIDYITSQGDKDMLTAAAEALAGTGHDLSAHSGETGPSRRQKNSITPVE